MKQTDLVHFLEELIPLNLAMDFDNCGMQVASDKVDIKHIAISLDPSINIIEEAISIGADFIISHHPLYFKPVAPNKLNCYHKIISLLLKNNLALYSMHTNLDSLPFAHWLADELEVNNRQYLEITGQYQDQNVGIGCFGFLPKTMTGSDLLKVLKDKIPTENFTKVGTIPNEINSIAICGGSGSSYIPKLRELKADIFITGDIKFHSAVDSLQNFYDTDKLFLLDVGHFSLEEEMMSRFSLSLEKQLNNIKISFLKAKDPFSNIME